jgi:hypothetical protein
MINWNQTIAIQVNTGLEKINISILGHSLLMGTVLIDSLDISLENYLCKLSD